MTARRPEPTTSYFVNEHSTIRPSWANVYLTLPSYRVTYGFQTESRIYICLNIKELLAPNSRDIWSLSDCSETRNHSQLVQKRTLNHLTKLTKLLSWVESTYLYSLFDFSFLSCHVRVSERIHTLYLREGKETICSKQARYLKIQWLQRELHSQPLSS